MSSIKPSVMVSDHALVRWMERTGLVDLEPIRQAIALSIHRATSAAEQIGASEYLVLADGLVFVVRNSVVVTVVPEDGRHRHARHIAAQDSQANA